MGLRELAEADLATVLEDRDTGFGWDIALTDPDGLRVDTLVGQSDDISQLIDPDTGVLVSGRKATATLRISSITAAGFTGLPRSVADRTKKPWLVEFLDINGNAYTFKVREGDPDRTLGIVTCILEAYQP